MSILTALIFIVFLAMTTEYALMAYSAHLEHLTVSEKPKTSLDDE
jgi:hypothetical protein